MAHYKLALVGFGNVGRALVRLLERKEAELQSRYDISFSVTGIATGRHGAAVNPDGLDYIHAASLVEAGDSLAGLSRTPIGNNSEFLRVCAADVMFENTPVNHATGQPAIDHLQLALELGMHAITANKGAVVHGYRELSEFAKTRHKKFLFESTVMDGAPIFSLFRMEGGESFEEAVKYAQSVGLAETDPAADVDGWDAAIKVAALINVLMEMPFTPQQVERTGIRGISPEMLAAARAEGKRWKLVCTAGRKENQVKGRVAPEMVAASSPLYSVEGSSSIVEFQTDTLASLSIVEGNPGPDTTAYGLLADFINAVR
jgi:homoserine dehydrogenase